MWRRIPSRRAFACLPDVRLPVRGESAVRDESAGESVLWREGLCLRACVACPDGAACVCLSRMRLPVRRMMAFACPGLLGAFCLSGRFAEVGSGLLGVL